jgi:hypothetical protein
MNMGELVRGDSFAMEQVMGGCYAGRTIWGERRKHRRPEETRSKGGEEGVG